MAFGERSPRSEEELRGLTVEALREYLGTWQSDSHEFPRPTASGLGEVLTTLVNQDPERFAAAANLWEGLDPTYLHGVIRGFAKAIQENHPFAWEPVLALCAWILARPRDIPGRNVDRWEGDPDWGGTRWSIVELLRAGFQSNGLAIPIALRERAWALLEILTNDPDPELEDEEGEHGRPSHSLHRAINSIRGRAIEGIMFYPEWIRKQHAEATGTDISQAPQAQLPQEAKEVLDRHLDIQADHSRAIRSLYGRWLPWLAVFDRTWAAAAIPRIFQEDDHQYWLVAWDSYICFTQPYEEVFDLLQPVYRRAVELLASEPDEIDDSRHHRENGLVAHLITFYWRGHYNLGDRNSLLLRFFIVAPDKLRGEAIRYIGRSLEGTTGQIETVILERLQSLWAWRLEVGRENPDNNREELKAFGWWFASSKSDARWSLEQLHNVLQLAGSIDPDYRIVERLAAQVTQFPREVITCAQMLVRGQNDLVEIAGWANDLRTILTHTRTHESEEVRRMSDAIIELLARRGDLGYEDLHSSRT